MTSTLQIGTAALTALATGVMLYVSGIITTERSVNFAPVSGVETGVTLQLNGVTQDKIVTTALTNTGGVAAYDVLSLANPFGSTGALVGISVECGLVPKPMNIDVGFTTAVKTATASTIAGLNNITLGTGSHIYVSSSGTTLWNGAYRLKVGSLTSVPTTTGNDCVLRYRGYDVYGR